MKKIKQNIIKELISQKFKNKADFIQFKRKLTNKHKLQPPRNADLLAVYFKLVKAKKIKANPELEKYLQKRSVRTLSGVAVIAALTKPYKCPGKCAYCPDEKGMPKSYLSNEPAVMRAILCKFDPFKQVQLRLRALQDNGHQTDKIELIIMGGTWSHFPKKYQNWFIKRCFDALNKKTSANLKQAQKKNEKTKTRCIGLTLETRPDYISPKEIKSMRNLGATRVELGVQHIDDKVLTKNKRGHDVEQLIQATKLLKQAGFKISYHMMPGLPGSTPRKDIKMFKDLFTKQDFQPDMLKIYPTVVTKNSLLYRWWKKGKYKPYTDKMLFKILVAVKKSIPYRVRISRLIRDIPSESIMAGSKISNLRQFLQKKMHEEKINCKCIRCREARQKEISLKDAKLFQEKYQASGGTEYFLSYEDKTRKTLFAFLRLRLPTHGIYAMDTSLYKLLPELQNAALIREVHTYGQLVPLRQGILPCNQQIPLRPGFHTRPTGFLPGHKRGILPCNQSKIQHEGFGKKLMREAEIIAKKQGFNKMAVISGIGVREYYKKLGYKLEGEYMVKTF